jgi:hypothetical protein
MDKKKPVFIIYVEFYKELYYVQYIRFFREIERGLICPESATDTGRRMAIFTGYLISRRKAPRWTQLIGRRGP